MYRYLVACTHGLQLVPWFQQGGVGGQSPSNYVKEEIPEPRLLFFPQVSDILSSGITFSSSVLIMQNFQVKELY